MWRKILGTRYSLLRMIVYIYTYFFGWNERFSFSIIYECKVKKFNIDYYIFGVDWNLLWF